MGGGFFSEKAEVWIVHRGRQKCDVLWFLSGLECVVEVSVVILIFAETYSLLLKALLTAINLHLNSLSYQFPVLYLQFICLSRRHFLSSPFWSALSLANLNSTHT